MTLITRGNSCRRYVFVMNSTDITRQAEENMTSIFFIEQKVIITDMPRASEADVLNFIMTVVIISFIKYI